MISGWKNLLLSLPTGVLSLSLAALFPIFLVAVFRAAPQLTERLEEAREVKDPHSDYQKNKNSTSKLFPKCTFGKRIFEYSLCERCCQYFSSTTFVAF